MNKEKKFLGWMPTRMVNEMIDIRVKEILEEMGIKELIKNKGPPLENQGSHIAQTGCQ